MDAGTFTLNIRQTTLTPLVKTRFEEYAHFLSMYIQHFDYAASYDEDFGDWELNMFLLARLENTVPRQYHNRIIPVVHRPGKDALEEFITYIDMKYDFIAIGSKPWPSPETWSAMKSKIAECKNSTPSREIKTHFFGTLSQERLETRRPYSADASSFAKAVAFDTLMIWNDETHHLDNAKLMDKTLTTEEIKKAGTTPQKGPPLINKAQQEKIRRLFGAKFGLDNLISSVEKCHLVNFYAIVEMETYLNQTNSTPSDN